MKLSELIKELQDNLEVHGDMPVLIWYEGEESERIEVNLKIDQRYYGHPKVLVLE